MKTIKVLVLVLMISAAGAFAETPAQSSVRILSVKRDIFYFKVSQSLIGGTLEVYNEEGKLIFTEKIARHKSIIDFYFQTPGLYEIKIRKNGHEESFGYSKSTPKPSEENEQLSMLQQG